MTSVTTKELHSAMKNHGTTDHWDVLVSYSQDKLQHYLRKEWAKTHRVCNVKIDAVQMVGSQEFVIKNDLTIEDPVLEFYPGENEAMARLIMDISGTSMPENFPKDKLTIEKGKYCLQVTLPVRAIHGDGDGQIIQEDVIHFADKTTSSFHITFHFKNNENVWKIVDKTTTPAASTAPNDKQDTKTPPKTDPKKKALQNARAQIEEYFHDLTLDELMSISIAEVSNHKQADASDLMIPKSFTLASQDGVLSVFISTIGGNSTARSSSPRFQLNPGVHYTPIPKDLGASIIISRSLVIDHFLLQQMRDRASAAHLMGPNGVKEKGGMGPVESKTGALFEFTYSDSLTASIKWTNSGNPFQPPEGFAVNMNDYPLHLKVSDDENLVTTYEWEWACQGTVRYYQGTPYGPIPYDADIGMLVEKNSNPAATISADGSAVAWGIKFDEKNQPTITCSSDVVKAELKLYEYDLKLPDLDFFRVSNVFAPGRKMIAAKQVMFPYDLVILGDISEA